MRMLNYIKQPLNHARAVPKRLCCECLEIVPTENPIEFAKGKIGREMQLHCRNAAQLSDGPASNLWERREARSGPDEFDRFSRLAHQLKRANGQCEQFLCRDLADD